MNGDITSHCVKVTVHVWASARQDSIAIGDGLEIHTREPARGNRANAAIVKMIGKALGLPATEISISRGGTSKVKEVSIRGITLVDLKYRLENLDCQKNKL